MHPTSTSPGSSTRSRARRLGAILFGLVLAGSAAYGVQTLRAAPLNNCDLSPVEICTLGGEALCAFCCSEAGGGGAQTGFCLGAANDACVCFG